MPNKFTIGRLYRERQEVMYYRSVDGSLMKLCQLMDAAVPNPEDRRALGVAIDKYIAAREREYYQKRSVETPQESGTDLLR